jgi:23S rRNA pseudouridine1911/1915/1917 synthase
MLISAVKLSSPATREFWEIPVLFEDAHLLALNKPAGLLTSPDRHNPERPNLTTLLHAGIAAGKPWARERGLSYLMNAHRLDGETSGVMLFAKTKSVLVTLVNYFGDEKHGRGFLALVHGRPSENRFEIEVKLAPHPARPGLTHVDSKYGKRSRTIFEVVEKYTRNTLLRCEPLTLRPHQIRVHLCHAGLRLAGDELYGGKPLWLSRLKLDFRLKERKTERPLISRAALHAEQLTLPHPVTGEVLTITAPRPKDLTVAVKYLRRYSGGSVGVME